MGQRENISVLFDEIPGGVCITTDIFCNDIIHNQKAAEFLRIKAWDSCSLVDKEKYPAFMVLKNGEQIKIEQMPLLRSARYGEEINGEKYDFVWKDGVTKAVQLSSKPLRDSEGLIVGAILKLEDLTENRKMELEIKRHRDNLEELVIERTNELELSKRKILNIFESITDGFFSLDSNWCFTYINSRAEQILLKKRKELYGVNYRDAFPELNVNSMHEN